MLGQVPIGFAMMIVGLAGFALETGWQPALTLLATEPSGVLSNVDLATVPLFLLMGTFASAAGFSADVYKRGGRRFSATGAAASPTPPSAAARCSARCAARRPRRPRPSAKGGFARDGQSCGYSTGFSTGTIDAAGGTLKSLIPPSVVIDPLTASRPRPSSSTCSSRPFIPAILVIALNLIAHRHRRAPSIRPARRSGRASPGRSACRPLKIAAPAGADTDESRCSAACTAAYSPSTRPPGRGGAVVSDSPYLRGRMSWAQAPCWQGFCASPPAGPECST